MGLLYGPSACGKSSLVKAGLLPRLAKSVTVVYVEAASAETEARWLKGLRRQVAELPDDLGLVAALAALRRGRFLEAGQKVLLVLDQFEQWLHAQREEANAELVQALRQCDGGRVQGLVLVRDDFWLAVSRFMQALKIRIVEGENSRLVDLFDPRHARKVLAAFGRAFAALPEPEKELAKEQHAFLDQAIAGLAQEGKVISVRLALFAEMVKGKPWTPATLREVGGTEGVGVTFLEETFTASTAPPQHRVHQKAAQAVLKALLPEAGTDIKGHMRSQQELLEASGYGSRARDFAELLHILDREVRLITPTDPEGKEDADTDVAELARVQPHDPPHQEGAELLRVPLHTCGADVAELARVQPHDPPHQEGAELLRVPLHTRYYQLSHDYLVHSLRDWLTRKQKETRRGRAELLLADRAAVWNARPENRQLHSLWQWVQIRCLTRKRSWTAPQRKMMGQARRYHALRGLVTAVCLILIGLAGWEGFGRLKAQTLRDRLLEATTADVPGIVQDMAPYRRWLDPLLHDGYAQAEQDNDRRKQLHAGLALLPVDASQVEYLYGRLLQAEPQEVVVIREALLDHKQDLTERLWTLLENPQKDQDQRFHAACALATFVPDDARWEKVSGDVAATLVIQKPFVIGPWTDAFKGAGKWLLPPMADYLVDEKRSVAERGLIAIVYGTYATELPDAYALLEKRLTETSEPDAAEEAKVTLARKQASIGAALLVMGRGEQVWRLLRHQPDPTLRSYLIDRLGPSGVDARVLTSRLAEEKEVSVRRALLLSLGEYGLDRLSQVERQNLMPRLLHLYRDDPDPGIHGAVEWLLRQWGLTGEVRGIDKALASRAASAPGGDRQWYINRQGHTMVIISRPGEFWMGAGPERHRRLMDRSFAIASKEVTVEQFRTFRKDHPVGGEGSPSSDSPVDGVTWYDAAAYCNWLSEQEGIAKEQWCYLPNQAGNYQAGMKMAAKYLQRTGYRLPTAAEWEYGCRAGAETEFSFGTARGLPDRYAWVLETLGKTRQLTGRLKPNDLGLFDMHGSVGEWTQDVYQTQVQAEGGKAISDSEDKVDIKDSDYIEIRGVMSNDAWDVRSASRMGLPPGFRIDGIGLRVARTCR